MRKEIDFERKADAVVLYIVHRTRTRKAGEKRDNRKRIGCKYHPLEER